MQTPTVNTTDFPDNRSKTFAMIKPDITKRGLESTLMNLIEVGIFYILEHVQRKLTREEAEWLYREHKGRDYFEPNIEFILSGDVVLLVIASDEPTTPEIFRVFMGPTDHTKAEPWTIRGRFAQSYRENSIHGSDSAESAEAELRYFFPDRFKGC